MKKLLALIAVLSVSMGIFADTTVIESVKVSPDLVKAWNDLKADKFSLAAKEFKAIANSIDDSKLKDEYEDIAEDLAELAEDLKALSVPRTGVEKTTKYASKWDTLKDRNVQLKARSLTHEVTHLSSQPQVRYSDALPPGEEEIFSGPYKREIIAS